MGQESLKVHGGLVQFVEAKGIPRQREANEILHAVFVSGPKMKGLTNTTELWGGKLPLPATNPSARTHQTHASIPSCCEHAANEQAIGQLTLHMYTLAQHPPTSPHPHPHPRKTTPTASHNHKQPHPHTQPHTNIPTHTHPQPGLTCMAL